MALGLLSVVGLDFMTSPVAEAAFLGTAILLGAWTLYHGIRRHHSALPAYIFVAGLACIALSHFAFDHGSIGGTVFAVLGGAALVVFNLVNRRLQGGCDCSTCHHPH